MTRYIIIIVSTVAVLYGCATVKTETDDPNDLSYLYNPLKNSIHPGYRIFHENENISLLSVKLKKNSLFFSEANSEGVPKASLILFYKLYNISQGRVAVDTGIFKISIRQEKGRRDFTYNIPLKAPGRSKYEVEIVIRDVVRNKSILGHIPFDKSNDHNRYNFKIRGYFNKYEIFNPILKENEFINILYPNRAVDTLYVKYYKPFHDIPDPPSMLLPERELDLEYDDMLTLPYSDTLLFILPKKGVYHITIDSNLVDGFTISNFGKEFPGMNSPITMIEPVIYLTNKDEVDNMLHYPNPKIALDEFWLGITGNVERSRELIRIYYSRVMYANYFFSSFREGWKTERGMIYIIYGPPDKVYKTADGEQWGYHKQEIKSGWGIRYRVKEDYLYFSFRRRENQFSDNDFTLLRSESITTHWEQAIRSWKSGIVFRLDNPTDL
ncbi:MAG: GWxTD domain-containing protein [Bacteroidales bacterium]|nr:GWxTD domain-containing protein [Bacteroidales bacterium]